MLAKDAIRHIISFLPENMSFEEIINTLVLIYSNKCCLDELPRAMPSSALKAA